MFQFVGEHPYAAAAGFGAGTLTGYVVSHRLLDIDRGPSLAVGAVTGVATVAAEAWVVGQIEDFMKKLPDGQAFTSPFKAAVEAPGAVWDYITGKKDSIKLEGFVSKGDPDIKSGFFGPLDHPDEQAAYDEWMKDFKNKAKQKAYYDAIELHHPSKS